MRGLFCIFTVLSSRFFEREKETEKEVSVSSPDNENKPGCMPSTGSRPKHISLAWTSYKQGNEKHMLESKVRSERLWVSDSHPKTFPLFFSCGLAVSNVISTALISHGGAACVLFCCFFFFFSSSPCSFLMGVFLGRGRGSRRGRAGVIVFLSSGKITTLFPVMLSEIPHFL